MKDESADKLSKAMLDLTYIEGDIKSLSEIVESRTYETDGDDFGRFLWRVLAREAEDLHRVYSSIDQLTLKDPADYIVAARIDQPTTHTQA